MGELRLYLKPHALPNHPEPCPNWQDGFKVVVGAQRSSTIFPLKQQVLLFFLTGASTSCFKNVL